MFSNKYGGGWTKQDVIANTRLEVGSSWKDFFLRPTSKNLVQQYHEFSENKNEIFQGARESYSIQSSYLKQMPV